MDASHEKASGDEPEAVGYARRMMKNPHGPGFSWGFPPQHAGQGRGYLALEQPQGWLAG
jgi:hypothetical protein